MKLTKKLIKKIKNIGFSVEEYENVINLGTMKEQVGLLN